MEMVIGAARLLFDSDGTRAIKKGDVAVVYGLGPAGLIYVQLTKAMGARKVIAVGRHRLRLGKALMLGADVAIDAQEGHVIDKVRDIGETLDIIIDATGADIVTDVLALGHSGMAFVPYGVPPFDWKEKLPELEGKGIVFRDGGLVEARVAVEQCIDWVANGAIRLEPIITHRISLEQVEFGLKLCHDFRNDTLKVVIDMAI
ncbi:MAG: zinc-binding dehydrogenase [Syntrophothermus sp.]|uniref:zinc-binding dehydrogenase n=1 Tax=Syntrophothermus sp. TaxID=2736299 RepID=UPI00257F0E39|nr:zinc-binding dehydrogenase [Syntrophothermus sp.]NSW83171.1 zinc-binding dehydrogenase [Syntrophothermus sp.]